MYIIQIADLHIGEEKDASNIDKIWQKSVETVKEVIPEKSNILLAICGDVIDSKELLAERKSEAARRYELAQKTIHSYIEQLKDDYTIDVRACVGNHDITHMEEFTEFVNVLDDSYISRTSLETCYRYCSMANENILCIFVNSCMDNGYKMGGINYEQLEELLKREKKERKKIIVMHHTIMSMFRDDQSSIRDAAELVLLAEKYNVIGILHGHIHGEDILRVGKNQCKVIGAGALFTRDNPDVNSQFNIIKVTDAGIEQVVNCRRNADDRSQQWSKKTILEESETVEEYLFCGNSFQDVYERLCRSVETKGRLSNIRIDIQTTYDLFDKELHEYLTDDGIKLGDRKYEYFELAKLWEAEQVPPELYFNHGSYFSINGRSGIDDVVDQMRNKPTSNRIVLSTYNMKNVIESLDDKTYLPSVESIQFGKKEDGTLVVHMQLRALEICRFLKINICEIDFILSQLKEQGIEFDKVQIVISAFQAQKRENFNCFLKAKIDTLTESDICAEVMNGDIGVVCDLLNEKKDGMETITKKEGLMHLHNAMELSNKKENLGKYSPEILEKMKDLLSVYDELDKIHKRKSVRGDDEIECEQQICALLEQIIHLLQESEDK